MKSTKEIAVTVANRTDRARPEPSNESDVLAQEDSALHDEQEELEEAITFLQIRVRDIQAKRELLARVGRRIEHLNGVEA